MLCKKNRLRKKDFKRVLEKGMGIKKSCLVLKVFDQKRKDKEPRFGFVVSQKVSKKAVIRNRVKRRLREAVRKKISFLKKGIDGIFIALPGLEEKKYQEIENIVEFLFKKMKIYKNEK